MIRGRRLPFSSHFCRWAESISYDWRELSVKCIQWTTGIKRVICKLVTTCRVLYDSKAVFYVREVFDSWRSELKALLKILWHLFTAYLDQRARVIFPFKKNEKKKDQFVLRKLLHMMKGWEDEEDGTPGEFNSQRGKSDLYIRHL